MDNAKEWYYKLLEVFFLPLTYWLWKVIAGSVGVKVKQPWTARLCVYFWSTFIVFWIPAILLLPAALIPFPSVWHIPFFATLIPLALVGLTYLLRWVIGPPFIRGLLWTVDRLDNKTGKTIGQVFLILVGLSIIGIALIPPLLKLIAWAGWWTPVILLLGVLAIAAGGVLLALFFIGSKVVCVLAYERIQRWEKEHPRKERPKTQRQTPGFIKAAGKGIVALIALFSVPVLMVYMWYKEACPVMTYPPVKQDSDKENFS